MMPVTYQEIAPHVARITLDRPAALNAITFAAVDAFADALEQAGADPDLRALIVTGAGRRAFCAGGDLYELAACVSEEDGRRVSAGMTAVLAALEALPIPTLAAVNGLARGGGAEIALACDLRYLSSTATIGFTQVLLGVTPGWGGGQRLLATVGYARALEWLLDGRVLTPAEALDSGLVQRVLSPEELLPAAVEWAVGVASKPPALVRGIKRLLRAGRTHPAVEAARVEQEIFPPLWAAAEHQQAVARFLNRSRGE